MNQIDLFEQKLKMLENANASLVTEMPKKVQYPFIEIESITSSEFNLLNSLLPDGTIPLMIRNNDKLFLIKNTLLNLETIKILSSISDKDIKVKKSKSEFNLIEDLIDYMLMEEYHNV